MAAFLLGAGITVPPVCRMHSYGWWQYPTSEGSVGWKPATMVRGLACNKKGNGFKSSSCQWNTNSIT